ncbi:Glu-tRNA(Gln) amidotransferase subunit GatE [Candidatus Woesearchaeota archaeon]|nr:Glu-tRNA(Gln) amidotransferase subunit GatE [Candidatus Woesearchaeota archaeon]
MEKLDYSKIGLKCGIEIHQRLDTHKLFCGCPSEMVEDESKVPFSTFRRELRAVAGETGEIDVAARHEMEKKTYFVYHYYPDRNCLVELDEEPPHPMNAEALRTVLQVCKMMNAHIVDEVQVMRKTVVNGSNTTGFQRTAFVGFNGHIEVDGARISIPLILIEEEAAKDISKGTDKDGRQYVTWGLDRLGIPLTEIATGPDIQTPEQCKAVAEKIGMILRSTGKVARGLGTIRQDVNVSVKTGARVEIKGAQDLKMLPTLVDYEARRQLALADLMKNLQNIKPALHKTASADVTSILKNTECKFVNSAIQKGAVALAFTIPGFRGLLGNETQPGKRVGTEISDYAKVKTGIGGMIHSDEDLAKYKFTLKEIGEIEKAVKRGEGDAFAIIVAPKETAQSAMRFAMQRVEMCLDGVPREVRKANPDGTTTYMRPMPGAARMYPETDIPPIRPDVSGLGAVELLSDKKDRYVKELGLGADLSAALAKSGKASVFENFVGRYKNIKPAYIAETMISTPKVLRRKYNVDETRLSDDDFEKMFSLLDTGKLTKDPVEEILVALCKGEKVDYTKYAPLSDAELEKEIKKVLEQNKGTDPRALTGKVMGALKGRADGRKIMEMLKKLQN